MTKISEIIELFKRKPYLVRMGANKIGQMYDTDPKLIREARNLLKKNSVIHKKPIDQLKILVFDIETSPMLAYVWSRWKQNIYLDQTINEWFVICWAAKWLGDDTIMSDCLTPEEITKQDNKTIDRRIMKSLWSLFDEANIVIAHHGNQFDVPKSNSRFMVHGLPPPAPYKQIDTRMVASKQAGFSSNKLDALAGYFGIPHKDHTDFSLWKRCLDGEQEALDYMLSYCEKDIFILEKVYLKLRPWIKNHPNVGIYLEKDQPACSSCGSTNVKKDDGFYYTNVSKYEMYKCLECESISRVRQTSYPKEIRKKLLVSV